MIWQETDQMPRACKNCRKNCYNCDSAGARWRLSRENELKVRRKMMVNAVLRLLRKIQEIDDELKKMEDK